MERKINEFTIPVPWGHIAVKARGNEDDQHVLIFHGIKDNAGSFDNLIPLLPASFYYISIDLPGHGRSSPLPSHLPIHSTDLLILYKILVDYFKKEKYIFFGHSYGSQIGLLFSQIYPHYIEKFISLDMLPLYSVESNKAIQYLRKKLETLAKVEETSRRDPPSYTYEEALQILSNNRYEGEKLLREAAEPLLKRSLLQKSNGKFYFSTDQRIEAYLNPLHDARYLIETLKLNPISVPALMIFAKLNDRPRKRFRQVLSQLEKNKNISVVYVDGAHDVHNNYPERVAPYINKFLLQQKSKL